MALDLGKLIKEQEEKENKEIEKNTVKIDGLTLRKGNNTASNSEKPWYKDFVKGSNLFDDGYDFGDVTRTVVNTGANAGASLLKGVSDIGTSAGKVVVGGIAAGAEVLGHDDYANKLKNRLAGNDEVVNKRLENYTPSGLLQKAIDKTRDNSVIGNTGSEVAQGAGYYAGMLAAQSVGVPWQVTSGVSSVGNELSEAYANDATTMQALFSAGVSAGAEIGSEYIFGGIKLPGTGKTTETLLNKATEKIKNKGLKYILQAGVNVLGEGAEEVISGMGSALGKQATYMSDKELSEIYSNDEKLKDFVLGSAVSFLTLAANPITYNNIKTGRSLISNEEIEDGNKLENNKNNVVNQENQVNQNNPLSININNNIQEQTELNRSLNNNVTTPFTYNQTNNTKVNNMYQSMVDSQMNNTEDTIKLAEVVSKIIEDKGYNIVFDENITNEKGQSVNALVTTNNNNEVEIRINPNSDRAGEFLLTHEISHAIKSDEMIKLVNDFASRNEGFAQAKREIEARYGKNLTSEEVFADVCGQLFGNQEFINSLEVQNTPQSRSLIKQIYELIKKLLNRFTQEGRYRNFVSNLEGMWRQAYANTTMEQAVENLNDNTFYYKGKLQSGEDVVVSDDINGTHPNKNKVKKTLENMLGIKYVNESNGTKISIENKDIKKFLNDGYYNHRNMYLKKRIAGNYGEILEISQIKPDDSKDNYKGSNRGKDGYDYYDINLAYPKKNNAGEIIDYNFYEARLVVRKDNGGNFAYDIDRFEQKKGAVLDKTSLSIVADKSADSLLSANNIPQNDTNVKSGSSTKYSMQESANNTQGLENSSFSFENLPKVKDGYTRLYRGLNNEYNPNYDRNRLDSPVGYDTLTDNYELAKRYGENVYYIDIPTNQIGNSVIDENPNSEYYGDRYLAYNDDKPAGLDGIKGNEYLLYTNHELFNPENYHKIVSDNNAVKYSLLLNENSTQELDTKGRKLSEKQQEFFKDSKVRDENGNLKVVYHTTSKAGEQFNIFDPRGTDFYKFDDQIVNYYTDSKEMSGSYADGSYQVNNLNNANNIIKRQYDGYINIANPYIIDAKRSNWNSISDGLSEYGKQLMNEIDVLEKNDLYYKLKRLYDKVGFDSKNASERFDEIRKKADFGQYQILGEYARQGNIDNIFADPFLNDKGKENVKKHLNDKIGGKSLKEIGLDLYNNKYDTLWEKRINEFKNENPIIKDFTLEDLELLAENYMGGKAYIESKYINKKTTNDIVKEVIEMNEKGYDYDGVIIKNVYDYGGGEVESGLPADVYVTFNSNQFKNADNTNPTSNEDIRYSQENPTWREHLEENYKATGTRTDMSKTKLKKDEVLRPKVNKNNKDLVNNKTFSEQVDDVINGTYNRRDMLVVSNETPKILQDIGLENHPITLTQRHLNTIMSKEGKYKGANYHDLGIDTIKKIPEALENPLNVLQSDTDSNSIVVITDLADKQDRPIIASIKMDGKGKINDIEIDSNVMTSAYGRNNYDKFMERNIDKGNMLYDIDEGIIKRVTRDRLQSPMQDNSTRISGKLQLRPTNSTDNNISQSDTNVKLDAPNKYSMSNEEKNTNILDKSNNVKEEPKKTQSMPTYTNNSEKGESKYWNNIKDKTDMLDSESKERILSQEDVKYYDKITNKDSLNEASAKLQKGGTSEALRWMNTDSKSATATDVAEGWILLKQYNDSKDYDSMVAVAKKMREMGTSAGQAVQAYNILARMTPEGMVKYAQSELEEIYTKMSKNKSKDWIDKYRSDFDLTPNEVKFISDTMEKVQTMKDGYDKQVELAKIQSMLQDKLPPEKGAGIKAWMRISMLFNPKTQVRNVLGNAVIAPVNSVSDKVSSFIDKRIAKKTGVRTTGKTSLKSYTQGFKKGVYESYNDFKLGINTRDVNGNRFEVGQGKSFNDKTKIGKALNRVDNTLSFMLDVGDRGFYEASFINSLNNQLELNNKTEATQEMIDIATSEALQRTWQDNNNYTKFVLNVRNGLNKVSVRGYGLGDVLIPFAKTPANLTKAIVDYSPVGLVNALVSGNNLRKSLTNGQYSAQMQHKFVQDLGKATAGTMLYVLGYALAKSGVVSGESDDDKDTRDFMKNTLGISSYSIKIGDKSFTYDWAQPVAAPLSIMANYVQKNKENTDASKLENMIGSLDVAGNILLEQSFLESINTVLSNNDGIATGLQEAVLELPSRAVPTLMKQIVDLTDGTQRQTFEYDKPLKTMTNKVVAKIPGASKTLSASVDSMGREIQKYGGENSVFNVMFNPANINSKNVSESASEIYRIYKSTGDNTIFPRVTPYYINQDGTKTILTTEQRTEYAKVSGKIVEDNVKKLLQNSSYKSLSDTEKSEVIKNIVDYSYNKAREEVVDIEMSSSYNKVNAYILANGNVSDYYIVKKGISDIKEKYKGNSTAMVNKRKQAIFDCINKLNISKAKKTTLYGLATSYTIKNYKAYLRDYINSLNITKAEKEELWNELYG